MITLKKNTILGWVLGFCSAVLIMLGSTASSAGQASIVCTGRNTLSQIELSFNYYDNIVHNTIKKKCNDSVDHLHIRINGEIDKALADSIESFYNFIAASPTFSNKRDHFEINYVFVLNSKGGDVEQAMRIGRHVRQLEARVQVQGNRYCYSSCVLILAGGVTRWHVFNVGIHRPYFDHLRSGLSQTEVATIVRRLDEEIVKYLEQMNIPTTLWEAMKATPPEEMHLLSREELKRFMLYGDDPVFEERKVAHEANEMGITSEELRKRFAAVAECMKSCQGDCEIKYGNQVFENCRLLFHYRMTKEEFDARRKRRLGCISEIEYSGDSWADATIDQLDARRRCRRAMYKHP
jgi:ATP-dependent protease ClpP protease subunit